MYTLHTHEHVYLPLCIHTRCRMVWMKALQIVKAHITRDVNTQPSHSDADGGACLTSQLITLPTQVTGRLASNKSASNRRRARKNRYGHRRTGQTLIRNPTYRQWKKWCWRNTGRRLTRVSHSLAKTVRHFGGYVCTWPACNVFKCIAMCYNVLQHAVLRCGVLQCVAVCCSVLRIAVMSNLRDISKQWAFYEQHSN